MKRQKSIQYRLIRVMLLTTGAVLLLTYASYLIYEIISYRGITERNLRILSNVLSSNLSASLAFDDADDSREILSGLRAESHIQAACVLRENGEVFSYYPDSLSTESFRGLTQRNGFTYGRNSLEGFTPIRQGEKRLGTLYIKRSLTDNNERLLLYSVIALVIVALSFLLAYLLSTRLQRRISEPIIALSTMSGVVSRYHDYSVRATKQSDDEIGVLTDAFNNMLSQIEIQNAQIQQTQEKLKKHAEELERAVSERTLELRKQKDFAETVINSSLVLIAVFDRELRFMAFNSRCEIEFGIPKDAALGQKIIEVMPSFTGTGSHQNLLRAMNGEVIHTPSYRSGVTGLYYESFMVPLRDEKNEVYAVLMTAHNITQIIESSERLIKTNADLQKKNEELEQFAYIASHDLQEPLRKIRTFVDLAKRSTTDPNAVERYIEKVDLSAERMSALIRDVLEYSRLGRLEESFIDTDLNEVIEHILSDFELIISQKQAQITSDRLPVIRGNKLQLHQLFANLLSNALKFNTSKPVIHISCEAVSKSDPQNYKRAGLPKQYFKIEVRDNGIGFDEKFADQVFTIFQRLTTREQYQGTGIGLALCKKIVENHNGQISVRSTPGVGTTFVILLPY